jgi:hypothetical protein
MRSTFTGLKKTKLKAVEGRHFSFILTLSAACMKAKHGEPEIKKLMMPKQSEVYLNTNFFDHIIWS